MYIHGCTVYKYKWKSVYKCINKNCVELSQEDSTTKKYGYIKKNNIKAVSYWNKHKQLPTLNIL